MEAIAFIASVKYNVSHLPLVFGIIRLFESYNVDVNPNHYHVKISVQTCQKVVAFFRYHSPFNLQKKFENYKKFSETKSKKNLG